MILITNSNLFYIYKGILFKNCNMKSVALIIPLYQPHFHFIYNLIDIMYKNTENIIDLFIVFSNEEDYNLFEKKDKINKIIIPHINTNGIINFKKFYALDQLKNNEKYDYFIVCDAEILIIPTNFTESNILNKINKIYENKIIYAGISNYDKFFSINKKCTELFNKESYNKLSNITNDFTLYFWFSDLSVYKREYLIDFLNKIKYDNINYYHFDYIIYSYYLILYHNFYIKNITEIINHNMSLETYNTNNQEDLIKLKTIGYGFSFINPQLWLAHSNFLIQEGTFLIYHLDR